MSKEDTEGIEGVKVLTSTSFRTWNIEINLYFDSNGLKSFIEKQPEEKQTVPTGLKDWDELTPEQKVTWANKRGQNVHLAQDNGAAANA